MKFPPRENEFLSSDIHYEFGRALNEISYFIYCETGKLFQWQILLVFFSSTVLLIFQSLALFMKVVAPIPRPQLKSCVVHYAYHRQPESSFTTRVAQK